MKKLILSLVGLVAIALSSVLFVACEKSKSGGSEGDLVGTWEWDFYDDGYGASYVIKFDSDKTGYIKVRDYYYGRSYTYDIEYSYNEKTDMLSIYMQGERVKLKLRWVNANKLYASQYSDYYDEYSDEMGPFIRQ